MVLAVRCGDDGDGEKIQEVTYTRSKSRFDSCPRLFYQLGRFQMRKPNLSLADYAALGCIAFSIFVIVMASLGKC